MARTYVLPFLLILIFIARISCIIPNFVTDTCYPDVEQKCDEVVSTTKADAAVLKSTVRYFLFTRKNPMEPERLHVCKGTLPKDTNFNPRNRLIVFIPGFAYGLCQLDIVLKIKDEYLEKGDFNVLLVDARKEYGLDYAEAEPKLQNISNQIAKVLQNIQEQTGIKNKNICLVGHSLGSQIAGLIANWFSVYRITGIDPAGVGFVETKPLRERLDKDDAYLVDIFHCNGGKGIPNFGLIYPVGDADFYINGGSRQGTCKHAAMDAFKRGEYALAVSMLSGPTVCAHLICLYYYHLSINNKYGHFKAWRCDSYKHFREGKCTGEERKPVIMGFDYEQDFIRSEQYKAFPRKYYLDTDLDFPFVKKDGGLPRKINSTH